MKQVKILFLLVLLASCKLEAEKQVEGSNARYDIELLFEVDGCKVYRFYDGRWYYFSNCNGSVAWSETHHSGKSTVTREYSVPTNTK